MDSGCGSEGSGPGSIRLQRSQRVYQQFVADAAAGLTFSQEPLEDPLEDLGAGCGSDYRASFHWIFRPSGVLKPTARRKTQERKLCRPSPRGLLPLLESEDQEVDLLQDSCCRTRLKRASGLPGPVHKAAHRNQHQIILDKSSKYHKNLKQWSSSAPQRWSGPDKRTNPPHTKSLRTDLTDPVDQVLTSRPPPQAGRRLHEGSAGSDVDSWSSAQCSGLDGDHIQRLIQRLLEQLFICQDVQTPSNWDRQPSSQDKPPDAQLIVSRLSFLSGQTTLVRSLLAEQLNSSQWRCRLTSCNVLCSLRGPVNKDVVDKLTHLMWTDFMDSVRLAAAETLMKLGQRHHVHSELRLKLEGQRPQSKMEALEIIGHLKLTTATLLEPLVSCLGDESTAVRNQVCLTAASLLLRNEMVVSRLLQLVESDPSSQVRLSAIRAVGALGLSSPDVQETLLRCVYDEKATELCKVACRLLQSSDLPFAQPQDFLLKINHVESNPLVHRRMEEWSTLMPNPEVCREQLQVQRLCDWRLITEKVMLLEKLQVKGRRSARLLSHQSHS